ncbi:unnamed protein product [Mytilus coruscus]|uniref:TRIM2_3 n=1 Tax=Mytilus coruscus TaxID=42192 RepID=A0A6J8A7U2_MYTCO|nr:unnamed protein product [Mytilus coruscus]
MGSISEVKKTCDVLYSPVKLQQAQAQPERVESILTFKKEITNRLLLSNKLEISDIAVTADNTLFLCNTQTGVHKIYVYKPSVQSLIYKTALSLPSNPYGISIFKGTDKAVVTLPFEFYIQFIDTKSLKLDKTIEVGRNCFGITTSGDYIAVGKLREIRILKQNGEHIRNIALADLLKYKCVSSLQYDQNNGSIIYMKTGQMNCIESDGTVSYQYDVSGKAGLAVDTQGHVYLSEQNKSEIQRFLPDGRLRDVVLTEKDGIKKPFAIAFNESFTKFYVTNHEGLVQIYNCN